MFPIMKKPAESPPPAADYFLYSLANSANTGRARSMRSVGTQ